MKAREVAREIQGLAVSRALDICRFTPKKAARFVGKTLRSAIANAEHNHELEINALVVKTAVVGEARALKRSVPRARGSGSVIKRRSSHITIVLSDEIKLPAREERSASGKKPRKKRAPSKKESAHDPSKETAGKDAE